MKAEEKRRPSARPLVGLTLLLAFAVAGQQILNLFGTTIHSFMVAGGILLLIISVKVLMYGIFSSSEKL